MRQIRLNKSARRESESDGQAYRITAEGSGDPRGSMAEGAQDDARDRDGGGATSGGVREDREHGPIEDGEGDGELRG